MIGEKVTRPENLGSSHSGFISPLDFFADTQRMNNAHKHVMHVNNSAACVSFATCMCVVFYNLQIVCRGFVRLFVFLFVCFVPPDDRMSHDVDCDPQHLHIGKKT